MTISVVGQKGGKDVVDKYGPKHMVGIGSKGGEHSHAGRSNEIETDNDNSKRGLVSSDEETKEKVSKKGGESSHRK
jgi:general stress protein YciG